MKSVQVNLNATRENNVCSVLDLRLNFIMTHVQPVVSTRGSFQRGAPASEGMMVVFGANAQVALRNQADQSALVIGGNLVTA